MEQYGGCLILNERNVFGPVCYNSNELNEIVKECYSRLIAKKYKKRYKKIVQFDDNKNTQRVIEMLQKDGII